MQVTTSEESEKAMIVLSILEVPESRRWMAAPELVAESPLKVQ
jgi:hypothetical protein